jgi:hypothetical protein
MSPLTDVPKSSLAATAQAPSPALSDEEVSGSKGQNTTASDSPDHKAHGTPYYERQLGDSEVSYYLQSRATGVNDMFVFPPISERTQFTYPTGRQVSPLGIQGSYAHRAPPQSTRCLGDIEDASPPVGLTRCNAGL